MKVTFPHMGNIWVGAKAMANKLGVDLIVPPPTSQRTLTLGVKHSPEMVCLPFKLTLGNMIEALDLGADTVVMGGFAGPCRFGYYRKTQEQILRNLGYDFTMVTQSLGIGGMIKYLTNDAPVSKIVMAFHFARAKLKALDNLGQLVYKIRAIERDKGDATRIHRDSIKAIDDAGDSQAIKRAKQ